MKKILMVTALAGAALVAGCSTQAEDTVTKAETAMPNMAWDHRPDGTDWTAATLSALDSHGAVLAQTVPEDIAVYCPGYEQASEEDRQMFWSGLMSALAKHESTWRQDAVGGGGRWFGLVQISPGTARGYGCDARSGAALKDGEANLSCAVRIWSETVPRDNVVSAGGGGVAADWGPFHSSRKRNDMINWTRSQSYCQAS